MKVKPKKAKRMKALACVDCEEGEPKVRRVILTPYDGLPRCWDCRLKLSEKLLWQAATN